MNLLALGFQIIAIVWVVCVGALLLMVLMAVVIDQQSNQPRDLVESLRNCGVADPEEVRLMPSEQRDYGDETRVPEGLGVARPPRVCRATHSPTTPLAYLPQDEWQTWTDVIEGMPR